MSAGEPTASQPAGIAPESANAPIVIEKIGAGFDFSDPNSPLAPYYMRNVHVVAVILLAAIFAISTRFPLWHTDVWAHLKFGQWMAENGRIPDREPFSPWWDGQKQPFTQFYTLTQLAIYEAYHLGELLGGNNELSRQVFGIEMIRTLHGLLTAARFTIMMFVFYRLSRSWTFALIGLGATAFLTLSNFAVFRPQTFSEMYVALLLLPLSREVPTRRSLALVPILFVVWANSHGSFFVGLTLIGLILVGRTIDLFTTDGAVRPWKDTRWRRLLVILVASGVAVAVLNPYGPSLYKRAMDLTRHPSLAGGISEWKPLYFTWSMGWHWVLMVSLAAIALTQLLDRKPFTAEQTLVLLAFGTGLALQERFIIWWALLVPWVVVPKWHSIYVEWQSARNTLKTTPESAEDSEVREASFRKTLLCGLIVWSFVMWSGLAQIALDQFLQRPFESPAERLSTGTPWFLARQVNAPNDPQADAYPKLSEVLSKNYPQGKLVGSVMASPQQGEYLLWALGRDTPVTYAHIHLFPPEFWTELGVAVNGSPGWWEILDKYRVNLIVVEAEKSGNLKQVLRAGGWEIVVDETGLLNRPMMKDHLLDDKTRQLIAVRIHPLLPAGKSP